MFTYSQAHKTFQRCRHCKCIFLLPFLSTVGEIFIQQIFSAKHGKKSKVFLAGCCQLSRSFNMYPEKWFKGCPVKSTHIFKGCLLRFFRVASTQIFFRVAALKKLGVILKNQKKKTSVASDKPWLSNKDSISFCTITLKYVWFCQLVKWFKLKKSQV